jgi:hypothetical protein
VIAFALATGLSALAAGVWEYRAYRQCASARMQTSLNVLLWGSLLIFASSMLAVALDRISA